MSGEKRSERRDDREDWNEMTPRERLESMGYDIGDDGVTDEVGHDGAKSQAEFTANSDPWTFFDRHQALTLRCQGTRAVMATFHQHPDGTVWYRWGTVRPLDGRFDLQVPVSEYLRPDGLVPVICPQHGGQRVQALWLEREITSQRRTAQFSCVEST